MNKIKIFVLVISLIFSGINGIYAQQRTTYEKKIFEINQKYFKILLGINRPLNIFEQAQMEKLATAEDAISFIYGVGLIAYASSHSEADFNRMIDQIEKEIKQAQKLKNAIDIKRENEFKLRLIQAEFNKSDAGVIKNTIKDSFNNWNKKGEFEKQENYENRLQNSSQYAFSVTCLNIIKYKIANYMKNDRLEKELLPYNADKESFTIHFRINGLEWQAMLAIPFAKAADFKSNWTNIRFEISEYDWCFVNNTLCPKLITLTDRNDTYQVASPLQNQVEISYAFNDMGLENPNLKDFVFKFSDAKALDIQIKQRNLQIVQAGNDSLRKAYNYYNNLFINNPLNIKKDTLFYNLRELTTIDNIKEIFNEELTSIKNQYNNQVRVKTEFFDIEYSLNQQYFVSKEDFFECYTKGSEYYKEELSNRQKKKIYEDKCDAEYNRFGEFFSTKDEFQRYYLQGEDIYKKELVIRYENQERINILNYFRANLKVLETLDLQDLKLSSNEYLAISIIGVYTDKALSDRFYTDKEYFKDVLLRIFEISKRKLYYSSIIDFVINANKDLNKEWGKNGQYFKDNVSFFNAYISKNYKQLLKSIKTNS